MSLKYYKEGSFAVTESKPEWNPSLPFDLKVEFELTNLDISFVNALRRILLAEVECAAIDADVTIDEDKNITVFNTEYLKDRMALQPIHLDSFEKLEELRGMIQRGELIFRIADKDNWTQKLVNNDNNDRVITCRDILVIHKTKNTVSEPILEEDMEVLGEAIPVTNVESGTDVVERLLPSSDFFTFQDMYLLKIKKGESIYIEMKPSIGIGRIHARWQSAIPSYRFKTRKETENPNYDWHDDKNYEPIKDVKDYPLAADMSIGKYRSPDVFCMSVEYSGHYPPMVAWKGAVNSLQKKVNSFLDQLRLIKGVDEQVTDLLSIQFSPKENIKNLIQVIIYGEDHTLGGLVSAHYLYNLERLVKIINPINPDEIILSGFSHYKVPHVLNPIENKLLFMFKTPEWSQEQSENGFDKFLQQLQDAGEVLPNRYEDDFYMKNTSLRLLLIVVERLAHQINFFRTQ